VLEHARVYVAELDGQVRTPGADEAARRFAGSLPEEGKGALADLRQLLERGTEAHFRTGGPRFSHWVVGGSTPAALAADWFASLIDQNEGSWDASPLAVQLEATSLARLRELFACPLPGGGFVDDRRDDWQLGALAAARQ
jgi:glutamate/tyrosine decarboxylase-like PLP-dependent enzyme